MTSRSRSKPRRPGARAARATRGRRGLRLGLDARRWAAIAGLALWAACGVLLWALVGGGGARLTAWLRACLGWGAYAVPAGLAVGGWGLVAWGRGRPARVPWVRVAAGVATWIVALALTHLLAGAPATRADLMRAGGLLGRWAGGAVAWALGRAGGVVALLALGLVGAKLVSDPLLARLMALPGAWRARRARRPPAAPPRTRPTLWDVAEPPADEAPGAAAPGPQPPALPPDPQAPPTRPLPAAAARPRDVARPAPAPPEPLADAAMPGHTEWRLPRLQDVLAATDERPVDVAELRDRSRLIEETMRSLNVPAAVVEVHPGPTVTQFGLEPGYVERKNRRGQVVRAKVRVSQIERLANDLALALAAPSIRIEAPVPDRPVVGIEVPNPVPTPVGLRGVIESDEFHAEGSPLTVALGRDVSGEPVVADLARLPHLLIAGATGSGKSVCLNALIACLLCHNTPATLRMAMVDPKRVELSGYDGVPHLVTPVVVEMSRAVGVLQWLLREMDRRYEVLAEAGARDLARYNETAASAGRARLPYIVTVIDELADLMLVSPDDVERLLCRLAQMARATGIHLVVATQRPSVDVVTGLIKANFPARIAFAVSAQIDSRVILDTPGAERLLGRGDALFMDPTSTFPRRIQGCWVSEEDLGRLVAHWRAQGGARPRVPGAAEPSGPLVQQPLWPDAVPVDGAHGAGAREEDALLQEAVALVRAQGRASASMLQRSFRIGYSRASRLIDALETMGVIGPAQEGSRPRDVLSAADGDDDADGDEDGAEPMATPS